MLRSVAFCSGTTKGTEYRLVGGGGRGLAWKYDIMVSDENDPISPQVFLIEQSPSSIAGPHFHAQDQFQVVVDGDGSLGAHDVSPVTVHYANGYTGYGPLRAGPRGLWYLTIRVHTDNGGARYLAESRHLLKPGEKLNLTSKPQAQGDFASGTDSATIQSAIIPPRTDGIAAWLLRLGPSERAECPTHPGGAGQFRVVLKGGQLLGDEVISKLGCAFIIADENDPMVEASDQGLDVLILQFPGSSRIRRP